MSASSNPKMSDTFLAVAVLCLFLSIAVSFQAGCAGDAKGGSLGNVELALHYGSLAMLLILAGMSMGSIGLMVRSAPALGQRATQAVAWFLGSGVLFWLAAFQAETWGIQSCF